MSIILVCTVGGSTEPIVDAIVQNKPGFVYFICSSGEGESASSRLVTQETTKLEKGECPDCKKKYEIQKPVPSIQSRAKLDELKFLIAETPQPDDLDSVLKACEEVRQDIERRFGEFPPKVVANYTGGTKTMSLALGLFSTRSNVQWALQVQSTGRRTDTIKIVTGGVSQQQNTAMLAVSDAKQVAELLVTRRLDFEGASEVVGETSRNFALPPQDKSALAGLHAYYEMRADFDRFDYEAAIQLITSGNLSGDLPNGSEREWLSKAKLLDRGRRVMAGQIECNKQEKGPFLLLESLIENAILCSKRQRFDDAVSRLYRATELLAQVRLKQYYGITTGDVDVNNQVIPDKSRTRFQLSDDGKVKLGLVESYQLLADMEDSVGIYWDKNKTVLVKYLAQRNHSYLAHGFNSITRETWADLGDGWLVWLDEAKAMFSEQPVKV